MITKTFPPPTLNCWRGNLFIVGGRWLTVVFSMLGVLFIGGGCGLGGGCGGEGHILRLSSFVPSVGDRRVHVRLHQCCCLIDWFWVFAWIMEVLPSWSSIWHPYCPGFLEGGCAWVLLIVECFLLLEYPWCYWRRRP